MPATVLEQMRRETEDLIRYYGEINRRVAHVGVEGLPGLLEVTQQVEMALSVVASQELAWMVQEVRRLLEQLVQMDSQLQRLRELKLYVVHGSATERLERRARDL